MVQNSFSKGVKDGIPIALGYLSVSFTFGITAALQGLPVWFALAISMTNLTSAGQFAGIGLIGSGATFLEMALTQLTINMRYALMSLSLTQKFSNGVKFIDRFWIAFVNTDEIFAMASGQKGSVGKKYMLGLASLPYIGWAMGTLLGAAAGNILPEIVRNAMGIAIYGMFLAIILPVAKEKRSVAAVVAIAVAMSCAFYWIPALASVSSGFVIIICAVVAAGLGALIFPVEERAKEEQQEEEVGSDA
ncbi:MAG: AzlC family ABC transporter permease [Oscillospiraceae bacterium]|nr:AzlC family ABC transporter permease [Oscillospiraceae bacterium]MBQ3048660.1 AzlC family ABC transporter permease [Oscillospiraceae bacterium]